MTETNNDSVTRKPHSRSSLLTRRGKDGYLEKSKNLARKNMARDSMAKKGKQAFAESSKSVVI
ncbi:hypothetical protein ACFLYV_01990 [Chloroflexota bacterium]